MPQTQWFRHLLHLLLWLRSLVTMLRLRLHRVYLSLMAWRLAAHSQRPVPLQASPFRRHQACRAALAAAQSRLHPALVPPLQVAQAVLVLVVDLVVPVLVVAQADLADQTVVLLVLPVPQAVPQVLPVPRVHQVLVRIIFPVVRVVATLPEPRYRALVFLVRPLVAAVDLVVLVVVAPVAVVGAELVLSSAKAGPSVVRRLKS